MTQEVTSQTLVEMPVSFCFCITQDGDLYEDTLFSSVEEALKAGIDHARQVWDDLEFPIYLWVGEYFHPSEFLKDRLGANSADGVIEDVVAILDDEMIDPEEVFSLELDKQLELGALIENFVLKHGQFDRFAVTNSVRYKVLDRNGTHIPA
jgi:hypothetical protein